MDFGSIPFLARATPSGGGGGGSLAIVQAATPVEQAFGTTAQTSMTAITSGNSVVVVAVVSNSNGTPTISDSASGSWSAAMRTYDDGGTTTYYFKRDNITSGFTWVRATIGSNGGFHICAYELSGAGAGLVEDAFGSGAQSSTSTWNMAFTSTVADVACIATLLADNSNTPTGTAPMTAATATGGYQIFARGIFPTAGSNTATVTLSPGISGGRSFLVLRSS